MRFAGLVVLLCFGCSKKAETVAPTGSATAPAGSGSAAPTTATTATTAKKFACASDADCILACDSIGDCCASPYCSSAMHRDESAAIRKHNEASCKDADRANCPSVGSIDPDYVFPTPRCQASQCVAEPAPKK